MKIDPSRSAQNVSETVIGAIKRNPEGLLLLAAGAALLMRSSGSSAPRSQSYGHSPATLGSESGSGSNHSRTRAGLADSVSDGADRARQYVADVGNTVSETVKDYASTIGDYADDARRTVADTSDRFMEQARNTMEGTFSRVLRDQPMAVAVLGLAAGAALAAVLPASRMETDALGPVGEKLSEAASSVRENLSEAASRSGERLTQMADERGLNADGLKNAAEEVAGVFGEAFGGEQEGRHATSDAQGRRSPGTSSNSNAPTMAGARISGEPGGSSASDDMRPGEGGKGSASSSSSQPKRSPSGRS